MLLLILYALYFHFSLLLLFLNVSLLLLEKLRSMQQTSAACETLSFLLRREIRTKLFQKSNRRYKIRQSDIVNVWRSIVHGTKISICNSMPKIGSNILNKFKHHLLKTITTSSTRDVCYRVKDPSFLSSENGLHNGLLSREMEIPDGEAIGEEQFINRSIKVIRAFQELQGVARGDETSAGFSSRFSRIFRAERFPSAITESIIRVDRFINNKLPTMVCRLRSKRDNTIL